MMCFNKPPYVASRPAYIRCALVAQILANQVAFTVEAREAGVHHRGMITNDEIWVLFREI